MWRLVRITSQRKRSKSPATMLLDSSLRHGAVACPCQSAQLTNVNSLALGRTPVAIQCAWISSTRSAPSCTQISKWSRVYRSVAGASAGGVCALAGESQRSRNLSQVSNVSLMMLAGGHRLAP